jgi:hypothetical protein
MNEREALEAFSRGTMTALDLRRRLGGATFGEVLERLGKEDLPLPRAAVAGRETEIARARSWMFLHAASA